ncbi:MAG: hypothetical protein JWR47_1716 [Phenylobacterium sp.]|jgi:hypothetical protein|uniref:hypothetical protein n=1 Tax=Phenylobacterium sp. TaxID=1871053 RepID=UPI002612BF32|nr:hypothetical protein [Phenylobacterium sp.]MDB5427013.1 hypothetical protein [Phenylobacterium sp.]MDB5435459.1 hypothetical protein [Phenylobacterium sp.]MDB5464953.1 hypothetical protein [Phenylobacterium sp.]MDB5499607.1 hypothetical protein [Phenylobacterium sp.]
MRISTALLGAASAIALALPALARDDVPCFLTRDMRNHTVGDDHTLYFDVGGRAVYRAVMSNNCLAGATSSDPIILRDVTGSGRICNKLDLDVGLRGNRCIVESLSKLTPAEAAALPKHVKP